ncbi:MAG: glycosyltransferase [Candidatus Aminicenantales bacterium]|jgi:SAM-dependent methyltransferase
MNQQEYNRRRISLWDSVALRWKNHRGLGGFYHRRLRRIYRSLISPGQKALELGCGQGDLLASLEPSAGVGIDFSPEMIRQAASRHPECRFICSDAAEIPLKEKFDVIILSDLINDLWDVQKVLGNLKALSMPRTRIIINHYSRLWEIPLRITQALGLSRPFMAQNWLTKSDVDNMLALEDFEPFRHSVEILCPIYIPFLSSLANRFLARIWLIRQLAITRFTVARPKQGVDYTAPAPSVSVIVPARNEEGNIRAIFERTPEMGTGTELVFVEGHSKDRTYEAIQKEIAGHPERTCILLKQKGQGKSDAVRSGFDRASGDLLMILDADLSAPPEDLVRFYDALSTGKGELINGVRLVYPREKRSMQFLNAVGNKLFGLAFSWLLGQPIKDTLCGTKALSRRDYLKIAANRSYFGDFDPFGDFDLLFGAAKQNFKIVDVPIRYQERVYGRTNIRRWKHGWLLIKMLFIAARRIKFI